MRIRLTSLAAFASVVAFVVVVAPAGASHSWGSYHWARTASPFTLSIVDSVSSGWDGYLGEASSDWSASSVLDLGSEPGSTGNTDRRRCRPVSGKIRACNYTYGNNGWLGLAQIWVSGSHISQATTKLNDTYFNTSTYNTPAWRRLVSCQEIAHDFGLDHQDENFYNANLGSCMDYAADPDGPPSNEHPNAHDYEQLESIYSHLDSSSTFKAAPAAAAVVPERVRDSLWVQDLGNGHKIFTFVFWVNPDERHGPPQTD